jgi:hypothetical protein
MKLYCGGMARRRRRDRREQEQEPDNTHHHHTKGSIFDAFFFFCRGRRFFSPSCLLNCLMEISLKNTINDCDDIILYIKKTQETVSDWLKQLQRIPPYKRSGYFCFIRSYINETIIENPDSSIFKVFHSMFFQNNGYVY